MKKLRPMGKITTDLEKLLEEMTDPDGHDMQWGEVKALVDAWLMIHAPDARETYEDGSHPVGYYGPRKD